MIFTRLGMRSKIQNMYLNGEIEKKYSIGKLKRIVRNNIIPHNRRMAAVRLYQLGERDFAINFLIEQMSLYLKPDTPAQTKSETCVHAAIELGRTKDKRAITPLLMALGELPFFGVSYALAQINGAEITGELERLASLENRKGIHAAIALGFMKHDRALPFIKEIVEHRQAFDSKYLKDFSTSTVTYFADKILGLYDNEDAKKLFLSTLTKDSLAYLISDYVHFVRFPRAYTVSHILGRDVSRKYGWDKYVKTDGEQFAFLFTHISHWVTYCMTTCPFKTQEEVDALREDIKNKIWRELGK